MLRINDIYEVSAIKPTRAETKSRVTQLLWVPEILVVGRAEQSFSQVRH